MRRSPIGLWLEQAAPASAPAPPLEDDTDADVLVVGGGYLGLWTALELARRAAGARIVLLEADRCGFGPSGRNGGFANHYWDRLVPMSELFGDAAALRLAEAAEDALEALGVWCERHAPEAAFRSVTQVEASTGASQDDAWEPAVAACARAGRAAEHVAMGAGAVRSVCRSPVLRAGVATSRAATVHPAHLALALRREVLAAGVTIHERSRVLALADGASGVVARTAGGRLRARRAVLALGAGTTAVRPLARQVAVASSHVVATRPVPGALRSLGWRPTHALCDLQAMLHYTRLTGDDRIVFGWGGGRLAWGARRGRTYEDPEVQDAVARDLLRWFPPVRQADLDVAWGGPVDVSPDHLPVFGTLRSTVYGAGFTGNGVAPSLLGGRILAALALDERDTVTTLAIVDGRRRRFPPPLASAAAGAVARRAMIAADRRDLEGRAAGWPVRALAAAPRRLGFHLPR